MFAVIFDVENKNISEFLGIESLLELSLLSDEYLSVLTKELKSVGVSDVFVLSKLKRENLDSVVISDDVSSLIKYIKKSECKNIIVAFSDIYFELNERFSAISALDLSSVLVTDSSGVDCCSVINKDILIDFLSRCPDNMNFTYLTECSESTRICAAEYVYKISSVRHYKILLENILYKKTTLSLPTIAEGVYSSGKIPEGDFVIVPPVYFGENVQIESNCVIGPGTVIFDNVLVSKSSYIKSSVVLRDSFISSGCFVENTMCCENTSLLRNSAVFSNSVIGNNSTISAETVVENDSNIQPFSKISDNKNTEYRWDDYLMSFDGYTPEKTALLGGALGNILNQPKIAVLTNGELNSVVLKLALLSGLVSTGAECYDLGKGYFSAIVHYINYCDLDYGVYVDGSVNGTSISIVNSKGDSLPKDIYLSVKEKMHNGTITRAEKNKCKKIRNIKGLERVYIRENLSVFRNNLKVFPVFKCSNDLVMKFINEMLSKLYCDEYKKQICFNINHNATNVVCKVNNEIINKNKLLDFVSFFERENNSDNLENWRSDAVCLSFKILQIISDNDLDFHTEIKNIPSFFVAEKIIENDKKIPLLATKLSERYKVNFRNNEFLLDDENIKLKIFENNSGNKIKILARSMKFENAKEIAGDIEKFLSSF